MRIHTKIPSGSRAGRDQARVGQALRRPRQGPGHDRGAQDEADDEEHRSAAAAR
jgi:hypothetical protein